MVFHGSDPDKLANKFDAGVELLTQTGATVVLFTGRDWRPTPGLGRNRAKVALFNENVHAIAARHGAVTADLWALRELRDRRIWDPDRLHLFPPGHHTVAMMVLDTLNVPHALLPLEPKDLPESSWRQAKAGDLIRAKRYLFPWVLRRLRPHGAVRVLPAKRPLPSPMHSPGEPEKTPAVLATG